MQVKPYHDLADRVLLGLLPSSREGWPLAMQVLKKEGGVLHVHENVHDDEFSSFVNALPIELQRLGREKGKEYGCKIIHIEKVKSYAPKVYHYVFDVVCTTIYYAVCSIVSTIIPNTAKETPIRSIEILCTYIYINIYYNPFVIFVNVDNEHCTKMSSDQYVCLSQDVSSVEIVDSERNSTIFRTFVKCLSIDFEFFHITIPYKYTAGSIWSMSKDR